MPTDVEERIKAWAGSARMAPRDWENAEEHERKNRETEELLRPILSPELYFRFLVYGSVPDVHNGCDARTDRLVEGIARHFGDLGAAIRAVADHVLDSEGALDDKDVCRLTVDDDDFRLGPCARDNRPKQSA